MDLVHCESGLECILRLTGRALALLICILGCPVHVLISTLITVNDRGPALYRCLRLGKARAVFELRKYRSMKVDVEHLLSAGLELIVHRNDSRVTAIGSWLRCGVDELPRLWHIVKGEMSWIGPRPNLNWMLAHYGPVCSGRLRVLPGITGFAQVLDSRNLPTAEGYALDIWYLAQRSFWLDLWIAIVTPFFDRLAFHREPSPEASAEQP